MNKKYYNFLYFIIGLFLSSLGVSVFYQPNNILTTGSTGLAMIINYYTKVDLSLLVFCVSLILLLISFIVYGTDYASKNILGTILFPLCIKITSFLNNYIVFEKASLFLLVLAGATLSGIGFGFVKKSGYSLGGFYVIYDIIHDEFKISVGKASLITNIIIVGNSYFIFDLDRCIYAAIGLYIANSLADKIMIGISRNKAFYIVTSKPKEIKDYIINNLNYTVTIVNAKGGYSNKKRKLLLCVIPTVKYGVIKEVIKEIDKDAFFLITDSYSVS